MCDILSCNLVVIGALKIPPHPLQPIFFTLHLRELLVKSHHNKRWQTAVETTMRGGDR